MEICLPGWIYGVYYFGDNGVMLEEYAWYSENILAGIAKDIFAIGGPRPVGQLKPNDWGLFDMLDNVWDSSRNVLRASS